MKAGLIVNSVVLYTIALLMVFSPCFTQKTEAHDESSQKTYRASHTPQSNGVIYGHSGSANSPDNKTDNGDQAEACKWLTVNFFIAVGTCALVLVSFWQVTVTRLSSQRELRAYVGVYETKFVVGGADFYRYAVYFANFGKTPAYSVRHSTAYWIDKYPLPQGTILKRSVPRPDDSRSILYAGQKPKNVLEDINLVTDSRGYLMALPGHAIYVYGEITYKDIFKKTRKTAYRFVCEGVSFKNKIIGNEVFLVVEGEGNEAD